MDDRAPPQAIVERLDALRKGTDDLATVLRCRGKEWGLACDRLDQAQPFLNDAVDLGRLANDVLVATGKVDRSWRAGDWIVTFTGKRYWPLDPRAAEVDPHDMAHALAGKYRFGAMAPRRRSVAAHSLSVRRVAMLLAAREGISDVRLPAYADLHDGEEAYLPDVPSPVKRSLPDWPVVEMKNRHATFDRFGLAAPMPYDLQRIVTQADQLVLAIEMRECFPHGTDQEFLDKHPYPDDMELVAAAAVNASTPEDIGRSEMEWLDMLRGDIGSAAAEGLAFDMPTIARLNAEDAVVHQRALDGLELLRALHAREALTSDERTAVLDLSERVQDRVKAQPPAPAATPPKANLGWLNEAVPHLVPTVDPRVERNKRLLMEGG